MHTMSKLAVLNGGDPVPWFRATSMWDALHDRSRGHQDRMSLLSPAQPADLYTGLTKRWVSEPNLPKTDGVINCLSQGAANCWYHATSHAMSWFMPPPLERGDYLVWSFAELQRASIRLGHYLRARGLRPGSTAVILLPVCAEWGLLLSTCAMNGYTVVTLDHKLLENDTPDMLQDYIDELSPGLLVVATADGARTVAACKNSHKSVGVCLALLPSPPSDYWVSILDIANSPFPDYIREDAVLYSAADTAMVVYTSGTSGKPKGCIIQSSQWAQYLNSISKVPMLPCTGTVISGSAAQSRCPAVLMGTWASGNSAALNASAPTGDSLLATIATTKPVFISLLVGQLSAIYPARRESRAITSSVRMVLLIGSTISKTSVRRAQEVFLNAAIKTAFGLTEACGIAGWSSRPPKADCYPCWNGIAASGTICLGARVKVVGENGEVASRNEIGELHLGGSSIVSGYLGNRETSLFYKEDGCNWFISGDLGVIDKAGHIYVVGRADTIFKRDGKTILPASVENVLEALFIESVIAVTAVLKSNGEHSLFAVSHDTIPTSCAHINDHITQQVGREHCIEGIASLAQLGFDGWPRTIAGKIAYSALKTAAENHLSEINGGVGRRLI